MPFITLRDGDQMNQTFLRDGRTWRKANATVSVGQLPSASPAYFNGQITYVAPFPGGTYQSVLNMTNTTVQMNPLDVQIVQPSTSQIDKKSGSSGQITVTATPGDGNVTAWYIDDTLYQADDPNSDISYPTPLATPAITGQLPNQTLTMTFTYTARNCGMHSLWPMYSSGTATRASQSPPKVRVFESPAPPKSTDPNQNPTLPSVSISVTSGGTTGTDGTVLVDQGAQVTFSAAVTGGKDSQNNTPTWTYYWDKKAEQAGGGNSSIEFTAGGGTSDSTVTCRFNEGGKYTIICRVEAACGVSPTAQKTVGVREIRFVDKWGNKMDGGTSFSDPSPTVTLDKVTLLSFTPIAKKDVVQFEISGVIRDALSDITGVAITSDKVSINGQALPQGTAFVRVDETVSSLRPHAGYWRFGPVTVCWLLSHGANTVEVSVTNAMGNTGSDSFTLNVAIGDYVLATEDGEEKIDDATSVQMLGVENHQSTEEGLHNPILVKVIDPSLDPRNLTQAKVSIGDTQFTLKVSDATKYEYVMDRPLLAIVNDFANGRANFVNLCTATAPTTVTYGTMSKGLHWAFASNSKPTQYKFASGTTVDHYVYSTAFKPPLPTISTINLLKSDNSPDSGSGISIVHTFVDRPQHGHTRALKLTMTIPKGAHRPPTDPIKRLDILYRPAGSARDEHQPLDFIVVPLNCDSDVSAGRGAGDPELPWRRSEGGHGQTVD
jgi:hypothetical protein